MTAACPTALASERSTRNLRLFVACIGLFMAGSLPALAQSNVKPDPSATHGNRPQPQISLRLDCLMLRRLQSPLFDRYCTGKPLPDPGQTAQPDPIVPPATDGRPSVPEIVVDLDPPPAPVRPDVPRGKPEPPARDGFPQSQPPNPVAQAQPTPQAPAAPPAAPVIAGAPRVDAEVVVLIQQATPQPIAAGLAQDYNITLVESAGIALINATLARYRIPDGRTIETVLTALLADARVSAAQPNYLYALQKDSGRAGKAAALQYALGKLAIPAAHEIATGEGIAIGLIDSGVDTAHVELAGAQIEIHNAASDTVFEAGKHGTALAGVLVAQDKLLGVAPRARLLAVRAFYTAADGRQETTSTILAQALDWSITRGAQVVNMSFAGPEDPLFGQVVQAAVEKGVFLVAAAGNKGADAPRAYPAAYDIVAAITATDSRDDIYDQANRGDHIDVAAPGVDILVPAAGAGYEMISGTSLSAAYITGIYALMLEKDDGTVRPDLIGGLRKTAHDVGQPGVDPEFGAGIADAAKAVQWASRD